MVTLPYSINDVTLIFHNWKKEKTGYPDASTSITLNKIIKLRIKLN